MNIFQTALALVATNIGGGVLAMPFAFYHIGIINAIIMCLVIGGSAQISVMLYLRTKDLTPRRYESVYEIAYLLSGKGAIMLVLVTQMAVALGCMILYYIILGDTMGHLFAQTFVKGSLGKQPAELKTEVAKEAWYAQMFAHRSFSVIIIGIASLLMIYKRHLGELKSISYVFLTVVGLFITLMVMELSRDDGAKRAPYAEMSVMKFDSHLPPAISIIIFAYAFQFMVFPAYSELENRSNKRFY